MENRLLQCNYETLVHVFVVCINKYVTKMLLLVKKCCLCIRTGLCPAKKKKSPPQLSQFFSYSESTLSKFSFALRL